MFPSIRLFSRLFLNEFGDFFSAFWFWFAFLFFIFVWNHQIFFQPFCVPCLALKGKNLFAHDIIRIGCHISISFHINIFSSLYIEHANKKNERRHIDEYIRNDGIFFFCFICPPYMKTADNEKKSHKFSSNFVYVI